MNDKLDWYWASYSLNGVNQGCINVCAENLEKARIKIRDELKVEPLFDDVETYQLLEGKAELPPDILVSKEWLIKNGY